MLFLHVYGQRTLVFKNINVDNGLSQNTVLSVLQDRKGYLWVGTLDGLSRFNGLEFSVYKTQAGNDSSISSNRIDKLFQDNDGNLWVGTLKGLNLYEPASASFIRYKIEKTGAPYTILCLVQDKKGIIWAGTDRGLYQINSKKKGVSNHTLLRSNICGANKITCLYIDNEQNIWIGEGQTLKIYNLPKSEFLPLPAALKKTQKLSNCVIRGIIQDHFKNYWIATETNGLFYYNVRTASCLNYTSGNGLLSNTVRAVFENSDHKIWAGTKKGLNIIDPQNQTINKFTYDPLNSSSLSQNSIRCIFKDNEHNIWIGTYNGGLNCVYDQFDNFYSLGRNKGGKAGLSYGIVNTVIAGSNDDFWIGTDDGGLNHVDKTFQNNRVYYQFNGASRELLGNSIKAIANTTDPDKLWVATGSGLNIFDKRTGAFTPANFITEPVIPGFIQGYVLLKDSGGLWIGTNFNGLYYLKNNNILHHYNNIAEHNVSALFEDGRNLWIGLNNKGFKILNLKTQSIATYRANPHNKYGLNNDAVSCIYKDAKARVWIGMDDGGIDYFDTRTNHFYIINESLGLANNSIHSILDDEQGRLWISTNKGLSSITFKKFQPPFKKSDLLIKNYSVADGLQSNEFTSGAAVKANNGNLVFAGINGITGFDPGKIKTNTIKPKVILTDFLVFNKSVSFKDSASFLLKPIDETHEITLKYNQAFFSIKFAALNFINPEKNQFAFKLEGFQDSEWHYVGNQKIATYTNLDPGTYYFRVKAANNDGVWNNIPRELKITILSPWYKTGYAFTGYVIIAAVLLYLFNFYTKKTERLKNELKYESLSHIKDQELARKQLSFFVNISHEIKTPLTMIMALLQRMLDINIGNQKAYDQLIIMQRNGERLIRLINQLLDKKKLETGHMQLQVTQGDIVSFIKEIQLAFSSLAQLKNITICFNPQQPDIDLWFDKDKLEKVLYNLLSNAIKFTPDYGKIIISVSKASQDKSVLITVEDNGCGIQPANIDKIFSQYYHYDNNVDGTGIGLAFSKELIDMHHGRLTVDSRPETPEASGYTRFTIELAIGATHFQRHEIDDHYKDSEDIQSYHQTKASFKAQLQLKKQDIRKKEGRGRFAMLVVEDNADVLNFIKEGFADDFEVYTAVNGTDGFLLAKKVNPDIIISDVMMRGMNGIELCSKLKSDMVTSHIPVILLTARTQLIFKMEGLETGADDYITKPFNFNLVEARVWNLIETRQKLRDRYQKEITLEPQNIAISNLDEIFLRKVLNYIEQHIADPDLSVEQLSQEVAMSKSSFYKKIKSLTNQTGVEFIRTVKVKRAAQLLAQGQFTVNQVAYMVGFKDVDYFRKCFKDQFNHTPKEHPIEKG